MCVRACVRACVLAYKNTLLLSSLSAVPHQEGQVHYRENVDEGGKVIPSFVCMVSCHKPMNHCARVYSQGNSCQRCLRSPTSSPRSHTNSHSNSCQRFPRSLTSSPIPPPPRTLIVVRDFPVPPPAHPGPPQVHTLIVVRDFPVPPPAHPLPHQLTH